METRIKLFGHPIHPMLIVLPLGLFAVAVVFDILYLVTGNEDLATAAYWNVTVGIVGGLLAAVFGVIDWWAIPRETRARQVGLWHGVGNVVIVGLFVVSWLLRQPDPAYAPDLVPFVPALLGVVLALVTAWLGGEMVYRLRVGVDEDAGLDASSSLSREGIVRTESGGTAGAQR